MNKITIGTLSTIIFAFLVGSTGCFEFLFSYHLKILIFQLNSIILMLGMSLGIISTFVEKKRKIWFYASVLSIIVGEGILAVIWGYRDPIQIVGSGIISSNFEFFWNNFIDILFGNSLGSFVAVLTSPSIIIPYVLLSIATAKLSFMVGTIAFYGFKGVILWLGAFHIYPEFYAIFSACFAGIRIALTSFKAFIGIRREGLKNTLRTIKDAMLYEFRNTIPKIAVLLVIAALLEVLWSPFWINYWLQNIL